MADTEEELERAENKIEKALTLAYNFAQIDGDHHKAWTLDQIVRALTGADYNQWINDYQQVTNGEPMYSWDEGIAP